MPSAHAFSNYLEGTGSTTSKLALGWSDVDWLNQTMTIERRIVAQEVDDVKTAGSRRTMPLDAELLEVLKRWKQTTEFSLDICLSRPTGPIAIQRQRLLARIAACSKGSRNRSTGHACLPAHAPVVA